MLRKRSRSVFPSWTSRVRLLPARWDRQPRAVDFWREISFAPANAQEVPIWAVAVWKQKLRVFPEIGAHFNAYRRRGARPTWLHRRRLPDSSRYPSWVFQRGRWREIAPPATSPTLIPTRARFPPCWPSGTPDSTPRPSPDRSRPAHSQYAEHPGAEPEGRGLAAHGASQGGSPVAIDRRAQNRLARRAEHGGTLAGLEGPRGGEDPRLHHDRSSADRSGDSRRVPQRRLVGGRHGRAPADDRRGPR